MRILGTALGLGVCMLISCASTQPTPGARPGDMSASGHEQAAAQHEATAAGHAADYDPDAQTSRDRCRVDPSNVTNICWTSFVNPTENHRRDAERHRKMADDHRKASQVLADAESRACMGIPPGDRDASPFAHSEDVASVEVLPAEAVGSAPPGAVITFKAIPGLTAERLTALVHCHLARSAAVGHQMPEMGYCPLALPQVDAKVDGAAGAVKVTVRSSNPTSAAEIVRRAFALAPTR